MSTAEQIREALEARWPNEVISVRIGLFASEIGWSASRAKDVYYADPRVALRAFEREELDRWLAPE